MTETLQVAALAAVLAGLGGLMVPTMIAAVPEPEPETGIETETGIQAETGTGDSEEPSKRLYADIAGQEGLRWRGAAVSAVAGGLLGAATGWDWSLLWLIALVPVAVALSVIDWHTRLLPRFIVIPATLATLVAVVAVGLATAERDDLVMAVIAMVLVRTFFWVLWAIHSAGMGFGDVRLAALVGLVLGWVGSGPTLVGVWTGFLVFALSGVVVALVRRDRGLMRKSFPYGPFMLGGALVGVVWGPALSALLWS